MTKLFPECMRQAALAARNEHAAAAAGEYQEAAHWNRLCWLWMDKAVALA